MKIAITVFLGVIFLCAPEISSAQIKVSGLDKECLDAFIESQGYGRQEICNKDGANNARVGSPHVRMRRKTDNSDICLTATSGWYIENPYMSIIECKDGRCKQDGSIRVTETDSNNNAVEVCAIFSTWTGSGLWSGGNWGKAVMCGDVFKPAPVEVFAQGIELCKRQ